MARKTRTRPPKVKPASRGRSPAGPVSLNKAPDLLPDADRAALLGWLGKGYRAPPGPPWPWEALPTEDRALFDQATARLRLVFVPRAVAEVLCWAGGDWRTACRQITEAADVECYPSRKHIRLIPRPTVARLLGLPDPRN
jgi:hypothetical protein